MLVRHLPLILAVLTGAMRWTGAAEAPAEFYVNKGVVTNAQVNARNFVNEGAFIVSSGNVAWDSQNTVNFTNRGTMNGAVGFRFETVIPFDPSRPPQETGRHPASNFVNAANASIVSFDSGGSFSLSTAANGGNGFFLADASYLSINAANVTNRGNLSVGPNGVMKLFGDRMDLSGGTLFVEDVNAVNSSTFGGGFVDVNGTNFFPAAGVYDLTYGIDLTTNMPVSGIIRSTDPNNIQTPIFSLTNALSTSFAFQRCRTVLDLTNASVWLRDDRIDSSNRTVQLIAVDVADTNIQLFASFLPLVVPNGNPQGNYLSPIVEFRVASTNFRTLDFQTNSFYVFDQLGSQTNYSLLQNLVARTPRPANFILFRSTPGLGEIGEPGLPFIDPDIFDNPAYSNRVVTNQWAAYSAQIESTAARLPPLPDLGVTNLAGRVEITADNLKLNNTRIRGEGLVSIVASNATGGINSILDTPRLNMSLASTTNLLRLMDMTPDRVERFGGFLEMYSGIWTNISAEISGTGTNAVTNVVETRFQLLAIRGRDLHVTEPVVAHELKLMATNAPNASIVYEDNLSVTNYLQIGAPNVTIAPEARLFLGRGVAISYTNIVNVSTFTNYGQIQANELAELRKSANAPFDQFVNRGTIIAFGTDISANYFENTGSIISSNYYTYMLGSSNFLFASDCFGRPDVFTFQGATEGQISITANTAKIDDGIFSTLGDVKFAGSVFKINHHRVSSGGRMSFDVRDILTDSGEIGANVWSVNNGFEMTPVRPAGDLLGTEIRSFANALSFVDHIWSAADRGATVQGFSDNVAIGRLRLEGDRGSVFQFIPSQAGSAIYIDVLEIAGLQANNLREFTNRVQLGMNVYYGNVESTNANLTAERLNGILGPDAPYNFYWVTNWAGPQSGVDVPLTENGPVRRFNRALRESANIDSDGDGLPNRYDPFPFPPEAFGISGITLGQSAQSVLFGFNTLQSGNYIIEYSTNLLSPTWQRLTEVLQNNPAGGIMSVTDQIRAGDPQRYYRVRKAP